MTECGPGKALAVLAAALLALAALMMPGTRARAAVFPDPRGPLGRERLVVRPINTMAFEPRFIRSRCVPLPAPYSQSTSRSRALRARRIDALGASPYLWDVPLGGLEPHRDHEPLNVLFLLPGNGREKPFLLRYFTVGSRRGRVVVYDLGNPRVERSLEGAREFPSFLAGSKSSVVGEWVERTMGIPVHHLVEVKRRCWPAYRWNLVVEENPLLKLASAYPGTLRVTLPPTQGTSADLLHRSLVTDAGLSFEGALKLLGEVERARENVELDVVPFDGREGLQAIETRLFGGPSSPWSLERVLATAGPHAESRANPEDVINKNRLVTFQPENLRGKLPPAQPIEIIRRGNPTLKRVAITIDDGWNADMRILDLLKNWKIRFTAFLVGGRNVAEGHPEFVRRIYECGGEVCSHTYTHRVMRGLPEPVFLEEIWRSEQVICRLTHEVFPYVRYSGGAYDAPSVNWAAREGFWVVDWTIDSLDTRNGVSADQQVNYILGRLEPGAILLFHFGGFHSYEVLSRVIPEIQRRGYEVTSLTRALEGTPFLLKKTMKP